MHALLLHQDIIAIVEFRWASATANAMAVTVAAVQEVDTSIRCCTLSILRNRSVCDTYSMVQDVAVPTAHSVKAIGTVAGCTAHAALATRAQVVTWLWIMLYYAD